MIIERTNKILNFDTVNVGAVIQTIKGSVLLIVKDPDGDWSFLNLGTLIRNTDYWGSKSRMIEYIQGVHGDIMHITPADKVKLTLMED